MKTGIIYIATNQENLKSYVGQTTDLELRKRNHRKSMRAGSDTHFHNALRKYDETAFEWRILEKNIPLERLGTREVLWIAFYDSYHNGYNSTEGDDVSPMSNPDVVAKMAATQKARAARGEHHMQQPEAKAKLSATQKAQAARGEHHSQTPEGRARRSATAKEQAERGEHNMQCPEVNKKRVATRQRKLREAQKTAGQQFLW